MTITGLVVAAIACALLFVAFALVAPDRRCSGRCAGCATDCRKGGER